MRYIRASNGARDTGCQIRANYALWRPTIGIAAVCQSKHCPGGGCDPSLVVPGFICREAAASVAPDQPFGARADQTQLRGRAIRWYVLALRMVNSQTENGPCD